MYINCGLENTSNTQTKKSFQVYKFPFEKSHADCADYAKVCIISKF